jgi:peroxiredoxin (alkyl hydroperoxide reductase subunit C)
MAGRRRPFGRAYCEEDQTCMLVAGVVAPDFTLPTQNWGDHVTLSDFRGRKHVVLAFHPLAFTPVCSAQVQTYERERPRLDRHDVHVLAVSNDSGAAKKAWADALGGVSFDLLSDYHPHGEVARRYGVLRDDGLAARAIFLIDKSGVIRWTKLHDIPEHPDFEELMAEIAKL